MDSEPYRLTFGKHKGLTVHELPPDYRAWLIDKKIYADKPDLEAALTGGEYLSLAPRPTSPASTPTRKRKASGDIIRTSSSSPSPRARKVAISQEAKRNGTMLNYDGTAYILSFGKHAGKKLSEVPSSYISWLIAEGAHKTRHDLASALREENLLPTDDSETPTPVNDDIWRAPSAYEARDGRFYDPWTSAPLWISDRDCSHYFGLSEPLLSRLGVRLVSEADLRRSSEFPELMVVSKGPKRWLYQVYACAGRNGGKCDEALTDFLGKNQRREREIYDELGLD